MSDMTLEEIIEGLIGIKEATGWTPSDEGKENVVEAVIDLLWPKASLLLRGDDWVLQRSKHKWNDVMEDILSQDYEEA